VFKEEDCARVEDVSSLLAPLFPELCQPKGCKLFNAVGRRWRSCADIPESEEPMVFLVPEHRPFYWPTVEVGRKVSIDHVDTPDGENVTLETLSLSPRVFRLHNFFTPDEADRLVQNALNEKEEANRLKRSSTGARGYSVNIQRTSENAFDGFSEEAQAIKMRSFQLLGLEEYKETWTDGLQVLRYNVSTAYIAHLDPFDGSDDSTHNYDSAGLGTNRYATILFYMTDVEEGGETVFPKAPPAHRPTGPDAMMPMSEALKDVRDRNLTYLFQRGTWQEKMVAECQHRLAVTPKKGDAILFYSQLPDGTIDKNSLHGGCPVLSGTKWAANLWVWNGPRAGYTKMLEDGSMMETYDPDPLMAVFHNVDIPGAQLYWEHNLFDSLEVGKDVGVNTFLFHTWNIHDATGQILHKFEIPVPETSYKNKRLHVWFSMNSVDYEVVDENVEM